MLETVLAIAYLTTAYLVSQLNVYLADDPGVSAWAGASLLAASPSYSQLAISRADYAAHGQDACAKWAV